ncbi:MAG: amidohydrolase [Chloroflexi bacterium]|nr:amidohydrolase [Chloroflexota bacterium]
MIVDFRYTAPIPDALAHYLDPQPYQTGYAEVYGSKVFGRDNPEVHPMAAEELVARLDRDGVDIALLKAPVPETVAAFAKGYPSRLICSTSADPRQGSAAVSKIERAASEHGIRAVNVAPFQVQLRANHKKFFPIYERCAALGLAVLVHTSINFSRDRLLDFGRPIYLDEVAGEFPDLRLVAVHGGWPWVLEMVAVAWRHPNVYIEISGVRPKYIATPNSGWDPLLVYGNGILQDKVLWASNWPMGTPREGIDGVRAFPLKESVKEKWLGLNAARVLGLR